MADLKTLCIDNECMNMPQAGQILQAGTNIAIVNDVINSLIKSGTNITVGTDGKVNLNTSPALTGTPTAPTNNTASASSTQIATLAFVQNAINRRLPKTIAYTYDSNKSVPNNTATKFLSLTAPATATAIGLGSAAWTANATGRRVIRVTKNSSTAGANWIGAAQIGVTAHQAIFVQRVSPGDVFSIEVQQNSGAALVATDLTLLAYYILD